MDNFTIQTPQSAPTPQRVANATEAADNIIAKVTTTAKQSLDIIIVVAICLLKVLFNFIGFVVNEEFDITDIFLSATDILMTVAVFYIFVPSGKSGRMMLAAYRGIHKRWTEVCTTLRKHKLQTSFREFCKTASKEDDAELRALHFERLENLGVTLEDYHGTEAPARRGYKHFSTKELRIAQKKGLISKAARAQIKVCRDLVDGKPYDPDLILSGTEFKHAEAGLKEQDHFEVINMALKPVFCIVTNIVTDVFQIMRNDITDPILIITSVLTTAFSIALSAYMGYRLGWKCIAREEQYLTARASFISRFLEKNNIVVE